MTLLLERAQRRPAVGRSCHIFELIGIPVQETLLGLYRKGSTEKLSLPTVTLYFRISATLLFVDDVAAGALTVI